MRGPGSVTIRPGIGGSAGDAAVVAAVVLGAALIGIVSRNQAWALAAFWPANALLAGLFARAPRLARPHCWVAAAVGYLAADVATGAPPGQAAVLSAANLCEVAGIWLVLRRLPGIHLRLERPSSIVYVALACAAGAVAVAPVGTWASVHYFDVGVLDGVARWTGGQLACGLATLPLVLAAPWSDRPRALAATLGRSAMRMAGPFILLVALLVVGDLIGGPAAVAAAAPALLWCALTAGVFETTVLTFIAYIWTMVALSNGFVELLDALSTHQAASVQLALSFTAMGPIAAAADVTARRRAYTRLRRVAERDALTGALTRRAFDEACARALEELAAAGRPVAVLMADLDHFKRVNDRYGHAAGDAVLRRFGRVAAANLRDSDLFGRVGGEEFAVLLPGAAASTAHIVAERVRAEFAEAGGGADAVGGPVTASIGIVHAPVAPRRTEELLAAADRALYAAKSAGRNRVVTATGAPPPAA